MKINYRKSLSLFLVILSWKRRYFIIHHSKIESIAFDYRKTQEQTTSSSGLRNYQLTRYGDIIVSQRNKGVATGERAKRIYVSKNSFYLSNELTSEELRAVKEWQRDTKQGKKAKAPWLPEKRHTKTKKEHYSGSEINKKRNELEGLIANNFSGDITREIFVTLTYRKKFKVETVKRHIKKFERVLKANYDVEYIVVPELNSLGIVHLHYLLKFNERLEYANLWDFLERNWKHGYNHISTIYAPEKLGAYLLPYFSKSELTNDEWEVQLQSNNEKLKQAEKLLKSKSVDKKQAKTIAKKQRLKLLPKILKVLRKSRGIEKPLIVTTKDKLLVEMLANRFFTYGEIKEITFKKVNAETGELYNDTLIIISDHYHLDRDTQKRAYQHAETILKRQHSIREQREWDVSGRLRMDDRATMLGGAVYA